MMIGNKDFFTADRQYGRKSLERQAELRRFLAALVVGCLAATGVSAAPATSQPRWMVRPQCDGRAGGKSARGTASVHLAGARRSGRRKYTVRTCIARASIGSAGPYGKVREAGAVNDYRDRQRVVRPIGQASGATCRTRYGRPISSSTRTARIDRDLCPPHTVIIILVLRR